MKFYPIREAANLVTAELVALSVVAPSDEDQHSNHLYQDIAKSIVSGQLIATSGGRLIDPGGQTAFIAALVSEIRADDLNGWLESVRCRARVPEDDAPSPEHDGERIKNDLHSVAQANKGRRECLQMVFRGDGRAYKKAGLIALSRILFLLATRFLESPVHPGDETRFNQEQRDLWEVEWYGKFLDALIRITPPLQQAVRDGIIALRDPATRAPADSRQVEEWTNKDIPVAMSATAKAFWYEPLPEGGYSLGHPDAEAMPPLAQGIDFDELSKWAVDNRIATAQELERLLGVGTTALPAAPAPTSDEQEVGSDDKDTDSQRRDKVVALAQAVGETQWTSGMRQITVRGVARAVQSRLAADVRTWGQRGPKSESTIRDDLSTAKWKFEPPKGGLSGPTGAS